jgi:mRNA-degrading endonuclease toxin of MazEF toxin-antitoxin module
VQDTTRHTTLAAVITSNTGLAAMPGDVFLPATSSGLRQSGRAAA